MQVALCFGSGAAKYLFGQEPEVASLVGQFCWGLLPGMWPLVLGLVLMKYLQTQVRGGRRRVYPCCLAVWPSAPTTGAGGGAGEGCAPATWLSGPGPPPQSSNSNTQNMMTAPAVITLIAFLLNIGFNAALIKLLGFTGAPLATSLSRLIQCLLLALVVYRHERKKLSTEAAAAKVAEIDGPLMAEVTDGRVGSSSSQLHGGDDCVSGGISPPLLPASGPDATADNSGEPASTESAHQQEREPLRGSNCPASSSELVTSSSSGSATAAALPSSGGRYLMKQPSWFRAPSSFKRPPQASAPPPAASGGRLLRQPSWFRAPSFRDLQGQLARVSSKIGVTELLGGSSGGRGGGSRHVAHSTFSGASRYAWAPTGAATWPAMTPTLCHISCCLLLTCSPLPGTRGHRPVRR